MGLELRSRRPRHRGLFIGILAFALLGSLGVWLSFALRVGPPPTARIELSKTAIGAMTSITATFAEPARGLGHLRLELAQGERTEVLAEERFARGGALGFLGGRKTGEARLTAEVGHDRQPWLVEGEAVLRASADRMVGALRSPAPVVVELRVPVRLHPPRLELVSAQHYVRQGGSGAVVFRVGESAERSGVLAGNAEFASFPLPGGSNADRFVLFGVPYDLKEAPRVRVFAEDGAGNRSELAFADHFKPVPERHDRSELSDAFLARVVPAISSESRLDETGSLLDRYLRINGELRRANLEQVAALCRGSSPSFLWHGAFVQMPSTKVFARFADRREYVYQGKAVDHQTHLGLDLASTARSPVPAANSGRVLFAGWLGIYGNAVLLDHGYGLTTLYGHLSEVTVHEGEVLSKGQKLGLSGASGLAGGDHLHLEVFLQGHSVEPVEWLDWKWIADNIGTKISLPAQ